ncbi:MAG TPA: sulfotransferase [Rhizomicrobium sp.]|jgi:Flp pilus assembly protein TadD|nr:sulfotransferase [Rhizomicrobium sp.]
MTKSIEKLDRENFPGIAQDIDRALAEVGRRHGVSIIAKLWRVNESVAEATISVDVLPPDQSAAVLTRATELCELGRPREAEQLLRGTVNLGTGDPGQLAAFELRLGIALRLQGRNDEALALFDTAQARAPDLTGVDFARSEALQQSGRIEEAVQSLHRELAREPDHVASLVSLAMIYVERGDFAAASESGAAALARDPDNPFALIALAIADIEGRRFTAAREKLEQTISNPAFVDDEGVAFAISFAADAYDRRREITDAFALYRASKARLRAIHTAQFGRARITKDVEYCIRYFRNSPHWSASGDMPATAEEPHRHVFLLGYTRSGTTLLESILAMSPEVVHADEVDFLSEAGRGIDVQSEAGLESLATLKGSEIIKRREAYWQAVRGAGFRIAGKVFIDKMPFNSLRLALICRLFPSARIIFAVRDPRDVVLGCFRRRFNISRTTFEFCDLDDCARFYASVMTLVELAREKLPLDVYEHRHEHMVADFEPHVRAACEFIGIGWREDMRDFHHVVRDVTAQSAAQVRRGLYGEGIGQWRRYRDELAPILPLLASWIARFGYAAD